MRAKCVFGGLHFRREMTSPHVQREQARRRDDTGGFELRSDVRDIRPGLHHHCYVRDRGAPVRENEPCQCPAARGDQCEKHRADKSAESNLRTPRRGHDLPPFEVRGVRVQQLDGRELIDIAPALAARYLKRAQLLVRRSRGEALVVLDDLA